jgi:inner membrane protein
MKLAGIVSGILTLVYGYSYWLLQMVDYALLVGSVGLFIALSVIMFVTRDIDWYSIRVANAGRSEEVGSGESLRPDAGLPSEGK